jgi:hypothetical protein
MKNKLKIKSVLVLSFLVFTISTAEAHRPKFRWFKRHHCATAGNANVQVNLTAPNCHSKRNWFRMHKRHCR